jgi:hypothetical protein
MSYRPVPDATFLRLSAQRPALQLPPRRASANDFKKGTIARAEGGQLQAPVGRPRRVVRAVLRLESSAQHTMRCVCPARALLPNDVDRMLELDLPDLAIVHIAQVIEFYSPGLQPQHSIGGILNLAPTDGKVNALRLIQIPDPLARGRVVLPACAALDVDRLERVGDKRQGDKRIGGQLLGLRSSRPSRYPDLTFPDWMEHSRARALLRVNRRCVAVDHSADTLQELLFNLSKRTDMLHAVFLSQRCSIGNSGRPTSCRLAAPHR